MSWVRVDDQMPRHPKLLALGKDRLTCQGVWLDGMCYASAYLTDGFIPRAALERGTDRFAKMLVDAGMWESVAGGYRIHDYHDYQPTRETVMESRRRNRERQSRHRNAVTAPVTNGVTNGQVTLPRTHTRPTPVPEVLPNVLGNSSAGDWIEPAELYQQLTRRKSLSQRERDWLEDLHARFSRAELVAALRAVPNPRDTNYLRRVDDFMEGRPAA